MATVRRLTVLKWLRGLADSKDTSAQAHLVVLMGTAAVLIMAVPTLLMFLWCGKDISKELATIVGGLTVLSGAAVVKGMSNDAQ